jgi:hypothetical protein
VDSSPAETIGKRPYELDWANRTQDHCPPLVDFEDLTGWRVESRDADATFERTREQQIWGEHVGKLTYRGAGARGEIRILPPTPIPISTPFDAVTLWCYGNNWSWAPDAGTPPVNLAIVIEDADGREFSVPLYRVNWKEWFLLHRRLDPAQIERVKKGARFKAIVVADIRNSVDRVLFLDNLAFFAESFPPLTFAPRSAPPTATCTPPWPPGTASITTPA